MKNELLERHTADGYARGSYITHADGQAVRVPQRITAQGLNFVVRARAGLVHDYGSQVKGIADAARSNPRGKGFQYLKAVSAKRRSVKLIPDQPIALAPVSTGYDGTVEAAVRHRLEELRDCAADEGIAWSESSESQLWLFLQALDSPSRPALGIDDNGDLRALWNNLLQEQVGVRFKGGNEIRAVLFAKTERGMRRETAEADIPGVIALVREMKLVHVTRG